LALGNPDQNLFLFFLQKSQFLILVQVQFLKKPDLVLVWFLLTAIESNGKLIKPSACPMLVTTNGGSMQGERCDSMLAGSYFSREPPVSVPTFKKICKNLQFQFN
jgi:hypothetical protein